MSSRPFNSATIVLGMHRSGTSALAGLLGICGLALPRTLVPAGEGNEKGFWESAPIKELDDELLTTVGASWHSLAPIHSDLFQSPRLAEQRGRAEAALRAEFPAGSDLVLKEPRMCRTLPYWEPVLASAAQKVGYAHVVREPLEVAQSLARRNDFSTAHGLLLWARYALDAEHNSRGRDRAFVSFQGLLDDWRGSTARLTDALSLAVDLDAVSGDAVHEFLTPALRHNVSDGSMKIPDRLGQVAQVYEVLRGWAEGEAESKADHQRLDDLRAEFDQAGSTLAEIVEASRLDRKRWSGARAEIKQTQAELSRTQRSLQEFGELRSAVEAQSAELRTLEQRLTGELASAVERLNEELRERRTLEETLAAARKTADELAAKFAEERDVLTSESSARLKELQDALKTANARIAQLERSSAKGEENAVRLAEAKKRLEIARDQVARLQLTIADMAEAAKAHAAEREKWQAERARIAQEHDAALAETRDLLEERSKALEDLRISYAAELDDVRTAQAAALAETRREGERALETLQAAHAAAVADLEQRIQARDVALSELETAKAAATAKLDETAEKLAASEEELGRVKHKYRAAQFDIERERRSHAATRSRLTQTEGELARYRRSVPVRIAFAVRRLRDRITLAVAGLTGTHRRRRAEALRTVRQSRLFDAEWYAARYPDVTSAGLDPLTHFMDHGWREGRDPGPGFTTSAYLKLHADVARAGTNPLLHYIEFGQSEGREIKALQAPVESAPTASHDFEPAADVFRGGVEPTPALYWRRSFMLAEEPNSFVAGDNVAGLISGGAEEGQFEAAFCQLAELSGFGVRGKPVMRSADQSSAAMADGWFSNPLQLRTRWRGDSFPFVVRAFQHDPGRDGALVMVGEGAIESELDAVEANLANPYFPVLFVFAAPDGILRGTHLLAFPSLFRGGVHYPEYLAAGEGRPVAQLAEQLADDLLARREHGNSLVESIEVDGAGSDGTSPLSGPHFSAWIDRVMGAKLESGRGAKSSWKAGSDCLVLPGNCVPTISLLTTEKGQGRGPAAARLLSLLVANGEPSQPATLLRMPDLSPDAFITRSESYPAAWPRLISKGEGSAPKQLPPAAIRLPDARDLSDVELLVPAMGWGSEIEQRSEISWVLWAQDWRPEELLQSLIALALQTGSENDRLMLIGDVPAECLEAARVRFGDRVEQYADGTTLASALKTELTGYLGAGTMLHERQTAAVLSRFLKYPDVASAGCALVHSDKRGKSWHVSLIDPGAIPGNSELPKESKLGQALWRSVYPVTTPPQDFWIARTPAVKKWMGTRPPQHLRGASHLCTTLLSASGRAEPNANGTEIRVPPAPDDQALQVEVLFG